MYPASGITTIAMVVTAIYMVIAVIDNVVTVIDMVINAIGTVATAIETAINESATAKVIDSTTRIITKGIWAIDSYSQPIDWVNPKYKAFADPDSQVPSNRGPRNSNSTVTAADTLAWVVFIITFNG